MTPGRPNAARAFTLVEVGISVAVVGILAVSALPALGALADSRERAAAAEVRRLLLVARSTAAASGRPTGLLVDDDSSVLLVQIPSVGALPAPLTGPFGVAETPRSIPGLFGGASIESARLGSGAAGAVTFWFAFDGTPQTRSASGALGGPWTTDGSISFPRGTAVSVLRVSGAVE